MTLEGDYEPSPSEWVREQVETFERTEGREGNTLRDTGLPIVVLTMRGHRSGKLRKTPVMRVEHDGQYAIVASKGGSPDQPLWYFNLKANPDEVRLQDGSQNLRRFRPRGRRRGAPTVVGAGRRRLSPVRRVPEKNRPADPGLRNVGFCLRGLRPDLVSALDGQDG